MKNKPYYLVGGGAALLLALVLLFEQPNADLSASNQQALGVKSAASSRPVNLSPKKNDESLFPKGIFDIEPEIPFHVIIQGNGYDAAAYFKHDTTDNTYYNFGFMVDRTILEDPNKIELRMGEDGSFQYMKANEGKFPTWYEGAEAKKRMLENGIGSLKYGSEMAKKYPEALYYQAMGYTYDGLNSPNSEKAPFEEVLIYPISITYDNHFNYPTHPDYGKYKSYEGLLIIKCCGIDYIGIDKLPHQRTPLEGELRRTWQVHGYEVDENAKSERSRFINMPVAVGVQTYEKIKEQR